MNLFKNALEAASDDEGLAQLGTVGNHIIKMAKDFDPRNYGYAKLSGLAKAIGLYKIEHKDKGVYIQAHHHKSSS